MKITNFGVAVIESDSHIGLWVQQNKRLDIAKDWPIGLYKHLIPPGGVVVDAGAFIGDHTVTYASLVGPSGKVYAFEPSPDAFECLNYNTSHLQHVIKERLGLSDQPRSLGIAVDKNAGASYLTGEGGAQVVALDDYAKSWGRLDFIKIDIEGFEVYALEGARETITRFKPPMFIEVNAGALQRAGASRDRLISLIAELGYEFSIVPSTETINSPQFDILCLPRK